MLTRLHLNLKRMGNIPALSFKSSHGINKEIGYITEMFFFFFLLRLSLKRHEEPFPPIETVGAPRANRRIVFHKPPLIHPDHHLNGRYRETENHPVLFSAEIDSPRVSYFHSAH